MIRKKQFIQILAMSMVTIMSNATIANAEKYSEFNSSKLFSNKFNDFPKIAQVSNLTEDISSTIIEAIVVHLFLISGSLSIAIILLQVTSILNLLQPIK